MLDPVPRADPLRGVDVEGADAAAHRDLLQVGGVGGVVTPDHHHQVEGLVHQGEHGVLALLGGIADGVEGQEVLAQLGRTEALQHRALEQAADLLGFALEHGGLVGHPEAGEVPFGVEAGGTGLGEAGHEGLPSSGPLGGIGSGETAGQDVIAHHLGLGQIQHHQIGARKRAGGEGFLVLHLAVDDRGEGLLLVLLHGVPHLRHPGAGGVDDVTAPLAQQLHLLHGGPEGRQDHHIAGGHLGEVLHPTLHRDEQHIHPAQVIVHRGVMDDLVGDPDPLGGVMAPGFIGHRHGPLHSPAEAEGLRQPHR